MSHTKNTVSGDITDSINTSIVAISPKRLLGNNKYAVIRIKNISIAALNKRLTLAVKTNFLIDFL